jgi:hypothetical protein
MITILDTTSEFVNKNYDNVATLFIQWLLRPQYLQPCSILINAFEIIKNGKQIDYATLPFVPLSFQFDETQQVKDKLLKDFLYDREFLL